MSDVSRFDEVAKTWDDEPRRVALAQAVGAEIARQVPLSRDLDVLDFGCGTGLLTLSLQPLVGRVTGADASAGMLEELRKKVRARELANVETVLIDPTTPLRLEGRYDLIVSSMALHHVPEHEPLLARFRDLLRQGGRIALADLDSEDGTFHEDTRGVYHHGLDRGELIAFLGRAGFDSLAATTAAVTRKEDREYPVFLVTGRKALR
jgi:cyclopropane fatty-acyl-phospholipid synthase-like methyltransferase